MAAKRKKRLDKSSYFVQRLAAAVSLLAFLVILAGGIMSDARFITITYRAVGVILVIGFVTRVLIRLISDYEEMNSGQG